MNERICRSFAEPNRDGLSWKERWEGEDRGLITCWEVGREKRQAKSNLARQAGKGELPLLGWKGGVAKKIKKATKYGTLCYLAQWQGLRGDDLDVILYKETEIICSKTGIKVIYTGDAKKYS